MTTWFDQSGNKLMTIEYKGGEFNGKQETFYKNGELKSSKSYKNNTQDGAAYEYYDNGELKSESNYKKGQLSGKVKTYDNKKDKEAKPEKDVKDENASKKLKKG